MRFVALLLALSFGFLVSAQELKIIPHPVEMFVSESTDKFTINSKTTIVIKPGANSFTPVVFFKDYIKRFYNLNLKMIANSGTQASANSIVADLSATTDTTALKDKYILLVSKNGVTISSGTNAGLFHGFQTLIQLLPLPAQSRMPQVIKLSIPQLTIIDYPRFAYRGLHLDVGRHFMPVGFIKKYIDYIALHKMNYFHWHLTEDQGWRIEIKKYPRLTEIGAWRNGTIKGRYPGTGNDNTPHGGFYTQDEVKEIVKYAAERFITIVPEIEMPGHSSAAIAAYPSLSCFPKEPTNIPADMISKKSATQSSPFVSGKGGKLVQETWGVFDDVFCAGKEETFKFLEDVLDEVTLLFPGKYVHVGGDECPKENWKRCNACQQRIKDNKLNDEHELQSYFIQRMEKYLNQKGKTLIGWDEILEGGLAPNAIVMSWRGEKGGITAAKQKHEVIMTPGNPVYFDYSQSLNDDSVTIGGYNPIEKVYAYEPVAKELNDEHSKYILGAQANMWTEYMKNPKKVEYMLFPRLAALSEVLWSPKEKKNWKDFETRLTQQFKRYDFWRINYSKAYYDIKATVIPAENKKEIWWKLETRQPDSLLRYTAHTPGIIMAKGFAEGKKYSSPIPVNSSMILAAITMQNGKPVSNPVYQTFIFNKATGTKITFKTESSNKYPADCAFTLINGVQNEKGMARSSEFLGFSGTDCEAVIDLDSIQKIKNVVVHTMHQPIRWIWRPLTVEVLTSENGTDFSFAGLTDDFNAKNESTQTGNMKVEFSERPAQYIKIIIKNWGQIPENKPGAGNLAWLFVDEIEIN